MAAAVVPRPPWCPPPSSEAYNNEPRPLVDLFASGKHCRWQWEAAMVVSGRHGGGGAKQDGLASYLRVKVAL